MSKKSKIRFQGASLGGYPFYDGARESKKNSGVLQGTWRS